MREPPKSERNGEMVEAFDAAQDASSHPSNRQVWCFLLLESWIGKVRSLTRWNGALVGSFKVENLSHQ